MTLNPTKSPALFSLLSAWGALFVVSFCPFAWESISYGKSKSDTSATLWKAVADLSQLMNSERCTLTTLPLHIRLIYLDNLRTAVIVLVVGAVMGWFMCHLIRRAGWERARQEMKSIQRNEQLSKEWERWNESPN